METKKKPLIILIVVVIIVDITLSVYDVVQISNELKREGIPVTRRVTTQAASPVTIIVRCVIGILVHLMGIFGAYSEHYCVTLTYAIIMSMGTLVSIIPALILPVRWLVFLLWLSTTIMSYVLCGDIKRTKGNSDCCCCTC